MTGRRIRTAALSFTFAAAVLAAAAALRAQEGDAPPPGEDPALWVLALNGHRTPAVSFAKALAVRKDERRGRISLFVPAPDQLAQYGDKAGVATFFAQLPRDGAHVSLLVRSVDDLVRHGDRTPTLAFLKLLAEVGASFEVMIVDAPGLAREGRKASLLAFARALPPRTVLHLYATPLEVARAGADAGLIGFLDAVPCVVEVHLDDPMLPALLRQWAGGPRGKD